MNIQRFSSPPDLSLSLLLSFSSSSYFLSYEVGDFSVLTRARTKNHLNVLEAVYISVLNPVLCKQKSFVTSLTLFQRTQRTHPP